MFPAPYYNREDFRPSAHTELRHGATERSIYAIYFHLYVSVRRSTIVRFLDFPKLIEVFLEELGAKQSCVYFVYIFTTKASASPKF